MCLRIYALSARIVFWIWATPQRRSRVCMFFDRREEEGIMLSRCRARTYVYISQWYLYFTQLMSEAFFPRMEKSLCRMSIYGALFLRPEACTLKDRILYMRVICPLYDILKRKHGICLLILCGTLIYEICEWRLYGSPHGLWSVRSIYSYVYTLSRSWNS